MMIDVLFETVLAQKLVMGKTVELSLLFTGLLCMIKARINLVSIQSSLIE